VVPDVGEELQRIAQARLRLGNAVASLIDREQLRLDTVRSRPVLADPSSLITGQSSEIESLRHRARRRLEHALDRAGDDIHHSRARVRALSPLETLRRGYAVVQDEAGHVVASVDRIVAGARFAIRVADGHIAATANAVQKIEEITDGEAD
jgi:exodeoxyribonuclease VII large subunit